MNGVYLGFDFGRRRIGVAAGQAITQSANPIDTVPAREGAPEWNRLDRIVANWEPEALVVGIPLHMDGTAQPETDHARAFAQSVRQRYGLPVYEADERLSSREAHSAIVSHRQQGQRRRTRKGDIDRMAASIILERWLAEHGTD